MLLGLDNMDTPSVKYIIVVGSISLIIKVYYICQEDEESSETVLIPRCPSFPNIVCAVSKAILIDNI
jgi:hypothetical protein